MAPGPRLALPPLTPASILAPPARLSFSLTASLPVPTSLPLPRPCPPPFFLPSPTAVGRLLDVREGERSFGDDAVPPLKAFTSTAQVPVGTAVPSILPRRASLRPPWAGTTGFQRNPWETGVLSKAQGMFNSAHDTKAVAGTSWWSPGKASALSLHGAWVPGLGRELRLCIPGAKRQLSK